MATSLRAAESTRDAIERIADEGLTAQEFLEQIAGRIDRVVPSDGYFVAATDPRTTLCIGPGVVHELPHETCQPHWDHEFHVPDYLKFTDLVRSGQAVADLHEATGGAPHRSPRFREYATIAGFQSELRGAFTLNGAAWGIAQWNRLGDSPRYSEEERAWLESIAPAVARGLRRALVAQPAREHHGRGPGVVILSSDGQVISATGEALEWLEEVTPGLAVQTGSDFPLPYRAHSYAARVAAGEGDAELLGRSPTRLRTRSGVWLLLHASELQGADQVGLVIEPAKAAEVAPLIVDAYGITERELDVLRAIARGLGTSEIAAELYVSPHTVRDHVKSVFEKVGVSSRGELVARVFADHYSPVSDGSPAEVEAA